MLKAYDFLTIPPERKNIQAEDHFSRETDLGKQAVARLGTMQHASDVVCPVCKTERCGVFFEKWGVPYFRCQRCESAFVDVDNERLAAYHNDPALLAYRKSISYQNEAVQRRNDLWKELLQWVSFRCFRYYGCNKDLKVTELGNRFLGLSELIRAMPFCGEYSLRQSIIALDEGVATESDLVLSLDRLQQTIHPQELLTEANKILKDGGLLFLSARIGTGFDVLVLRENSQIYPYEYVLLPSVKGICSMLKNAGFELLEHSTPGQMDIGYVLGHRAEIDEQNYFIKCMMENCNSAMLAEFQRFLQKSGLSSYAHIVARKKVSK